jgi:hypothetical protein
MKANTLSFPIMLKNADTPKNRLSINNASEAIVSGNSSEGLFPFDVEINSLTSWKKILPQDTTDIAYISTTHTKLTHLFLMFVSIH